MLLIWLESKNRTMFLSPSLSILFARHHGTQFNIYLAPLPFPIPSSNSPNTRSITTNITPSNTTLKISQPNRRIKLSIESLDLPFLASLTNTSAILLCLFDLGDCNTLDIEARRWKHVSEGNSIAGGPGVEEFKGDTGLGLFTSEEGGFGVEGDFAELGL